MRRPLATGTILSLYGGIALQAGDLEPSEMAAKMHLDPAILAIVGDPEYGEYLASECLTCHQSDGRDDGIPAISGWSIGDFVVTMHAYKQEVRRHPIMNMLAGRLSNEEIAALAAYFHELEKRANN